VLDEHTSCDDGAHQAARERRAASAPAWGKLATGREPGRLYLYGEPIHCGAGLELQQQVYGSDDFGEYRLLLPVGTRVRYELDWGWGPPKRHVVYTSVGGYNFVKQIDIEWMRFRWPPR
jgi:hypothetical protein